MTTCVGGTEDAISKFIDDMNEQYLSLHKAFEDNFWSTKMALAGNSTEELTQTKLQMDAFLRDKSNLARVRDQMSAAPTPDQLKVLQIMEKTFLCYIMESEEAERLAEKCTGMEDSLSAARNKMALGYTDPHTGAFMPGSSVLLRTTMRTNDDETVRKACYEGMCTIGSFVAEEFAQIVKARNAMAKKLGYEDFYDYKVTQAEGFNKRRLFSMLDGLEEETRPLMQAARALLAKEKGQDALQPWNTGYALAGDVDKLQDPYFPFETAPSVWGRSFAAMGINYKASTMNLDLCDRQHKYSNGFCHWPVAPYKKTDGTWVPAQTNFTSLATPSAIGSGVSALATLMHEGGHAAHFANIEQGSPFFSQERAPTSVAYAENQSMFLDSLVGDAAFLARYAISREGKVMPFELIEQSIKAKHAYKIMGVRSMLSVPYFEKALYELAEDEVTAENILALSEKVAIEIEGGASGRPLMSVPHILADESSCYYHGYVLAEMSVHQTRSHFFKKYDEIVDNPQIGKDLTEVYWRPGNGEAFLDLVEKLTGEPLNSSAWVSDLQVKVEDKVKHEQTDYDKAIKVGAKNSSADALGMRAIFVHGDEVISDSQVEDGFDPACKKFEEWVQATYFQKTATV
eukprot:CAMPEP_0196573684 /NCGR_PEP_ID=MMETSP1081-20130531/3543_1 /TAXON_ID=36882 /ORGANISM="Pyramimonas amylifera, Strain CCMP720" /LENGTH=627 /DNA_ID=CAMNT_0041891487 /DNA_START=175 /DNA_END=2058 /DNA_ORIENTATION=+